MTGDVELTDLGSFSGSGDLVVRHGDNPVIDMSMDFLHNGLPRREMTATWVDPPSTTINPPPVDDQMLFGLLSHPDVASKEDIIRRYDHEVRAGTVVRPLVGRNADGPGDAAVIKPLGTNHTPLAAVLSNGLCPRVGKHDPYAMALLALDEAVRNLVAVGGNPDLGGPARQFLLGRPDQE